MTVVNFCFVNPSLNEEERNLIRPKRQSALASGFDLASAQQEPIVINPREHALISTGVAIALKAGLEAQVRSRSGLAHKHGVVVLNSPGTIDADYRGEIKVILFNHFAAPFTITFGMRIAQLVIAPVILPDLNEMLKLDESSRGDRGFGSTGLLDSHYLGV